MRVHHSRLSTAAAVVCAAALTFGGTSVAIAQGTGQSPSTPMSDAAQPTGEDRSSALVVLTTEPLATAVSARTPSGRIALGSAEARAHRDRMTEEKQAFQTWLRDHAPRAKVVGSHDLAVNAVSVTLNGESLSTLREAPQVSAAQFEAVYHPLKKKPTAPSTSVDTEDPQLALIDATQAWATGRVGGGADAGRLPDGSRVRVGIIDTGIDLTHPCFDDTGYPAADTTPESPLTNNKVIVAKVFHNKTVSRGFTPVDENGHGTHVAGTVACNLETPAEIDVPGGTDVTIAYLPSGVAPAAQLGNYSVFPGPGGSARSEDILNALEAAYVDGMDLVNMSLGGGASGIQDLLTIAVDNLDRAGMVSVVAAGNDGPGQYTVGSPGSAERALTVGASAVGHFVGSHVLAAGEKHRAASGDFAIFTEKTTLPLGVAKGSSGLSEACYPLSEDLTGTIALVSRGDCPFTVKIRNAQTAGADGVLVANNAAGDPSAMGGDGSADQPTIPAYMVSQDAGKALAAAADGKDAFPVTVEAPGYHTTEGDLVMAGFSSQGPTDVDWRVKPDVVAPGVNVLSAQPVSFCGGAAEPETTCWAFYQGTSMATPHVAGAAAVVIDQFRSAGRLYSAEEVRSALVNTAVEAGLTRSTDGTTPATDVNVIGAGQLDLDSAVGARVAIGPVSTSFGRVPSGSGQTLTRTVRLRSLSGSALTVTLGLADRRDAVTFSVSRTSVEIPATGWTEVTLSAVVGRGAPGGDYQGHLTVLEGAQVAHSPLYLRVG